MGDIGQTIFGGKKSASNQHNDAFPYLSSALKGPIGEGASASSAIANMLGLNGGPAQTQGFDNWRKSTGYQFGLDQGSKAITGNAAARGLLGSGSTLRALETFGQDYASTKYGDYMDQLSNLLKSGIAGAGVLSSAGTVMNSKSSEKPGIAGFIGQMLAK